MLVFAATSLPWGSGGAAGGFRAAAATLGEFANRLSFTLTGIDPVVTTSASANLVSVTGRYTNTGPDPIGELSYRFQRGDPLRTVASVRDETTQPTQPVAVINPTFRPLPGTLAAGQRADFSVAAAVTGSDTESLGITAPGVYPVMININGTVHAADGDTQARVGEVHFLLTVVSVPGTVAIPSAHSAPAPVGILWPLIDRPHLGLGGVFRSDELAAEIEPGGRLADAVAMLADSTADPNLVTLAIDPMLLDELNRMSQGYWVSASPDLPQPGLRPPTAQPTPASPSPTPTSSIPTQPSSGSSSESTSPTTDPAKQPAPAGGSSAPAASGTSDVTTIPGGSGSDATGPETPATEGGVPRTAGIPSLDAATTTSAAAPSGSSSSPTSPAPAQQSPTASPPRPQPPDTVAGTGQAAAAAFLDELRGLATTHAVLVLPYGNPDIVALARAGMAGEIATAVYRGRAIASNVLGQGLDAPGSNLVTDVAAPPGGVLTGQAWQVLRSLGYTSAILDPSGVSAAGKSGAATGLVTVSVKGDEIPAVVSGGGHATAFSRVLESGAPADWASAVNTLAAITMVQGAATTGPMVVAPPPTFSPRGTGFLALATALDDLAMVGMVLPMPVTAMARGAEPGSTDGSAQALAASPQTAVVLHYGTSALAAELPAWYLSRLQKIQQYLDVLGQTLSSAPTGPDPADILSTLSDALLGATSVAWRGHGDPDALVLHSVDATIGWLYNGVTIARDTGSYTLASSTAPLMLTVNNTLPYQVTMTLRIIGGEQAGLVAEDPGRVVIGPGPRSSPVRIHSVVSRSGTFTVYAQLQGADRSQWGQAVPLTIDSRAYGALTVVLMAVASGVLLLMVIWRLVQRWRDRGEEDDAAGDGGDGATGESAGDDEPVADAAQDREGAAARDGTSAPRAATYVMAHNGPGSGAATTGGSARGEADVATDGATVHDVDRAAGETDAPEVPAEGAAP